MTAKNKVRAYCVQKYKLQNMLSNCLTSEEIFVLRKKFKVFVRREN